MHLWGAAQGEHRMMMIGEDPTIVDGPFGSVIDRGHCSLVRGFVGDVAAKGLPEKGVWLRKIKSIDLVNEKVEYYPEPHKPVDTDVKYNEILSAVKTWRDTDGKHGDGGPGDNLFMYSVWSIVHLDYLKLYPMMGG